MAGIDARFGEQISADLSSLTVPTIVRPHRPEVQVAKRKQFRTIWISDIHLGTKGCNADLLIDFLDHTDSETLYLVGDIIDGWRLKKKFFWPPEHNDIVWRILKRARRGTRIVYIPGNHDEMARQFCGMNFGGVEIERAAFHTTADGRKLIILHGDEFDTVMLAHRWLAFIGDAAYHFMMQINGVVSAVRNLLGLPYWSISKAAKNRVKNAVEFISKYEELGQTLDDVPALLAGRPRDAGPDRGAILCVCHDIGALEIEAAIASGADSVPAIGASCRAGTNCGSCRPELARMLAEMLEDMKEAAE